MSPLTCATLAQCRPSAAQQRFFSRARPHRAWILCQAQQDRGSQQPQQPETSRRAALLGAAALVAAVPLLAAAPAQAENEAVTRGLNKYIKRKKYDNIESYLPPLIAARGQLIRSGYLMAQSSDSARVMLREGAFSGLRDNVRAVGDYATQAGQGEEGPKRVAAFFKSLEAYDYALLQGSRTEGGIDVEAGQAKLKEAVAALDSLLELVPQDKVKKAEGIVSELEAELQSELEELAAEEQLRQQQELERLL